MASPTTESPRRMPPPAPRAETPSQPPPNPPEALGSALLEDESEQAEAARQPIVRNKEVIAGFARAVASLQGAIPADWADRDRAARVIASKIPRITLARLVVFCREQKVDLSVVAARVLTDAFATEPGLLEMTPEEAAEEGMALIQSMWPQGAFQPRVKV
jgi:hypothetical protein